MRLLIQIFLVVGILGALFFMFRGGGSLRSQALRRLAFFFFAVITLLSVFIPQQLTAVAHSLGVGRGTDLLLYGLIVVVFSVFASYFRHTKYVERNMTTLARRIALDEAAQPKNDSKE